MKLHPRDDQIGAARLALMEAVIKWRRDYPDLTYSEVFSIVGDVVGVQITVKAKYLIREEHHGNAETLGGVAASDDTPEV